MKTLLICLALLSIPMHVTSSSDPVSIQLSTGDAPEAGWTVGDRIPLRITATYPQNLEVILPELPKAWGSFEVLDQTLLEPIENENGTLAIAREATVTLWAPGDYQTPPLLIHYRDSDGVLHEIEAPSQRITIVSVLEEGETEKRDLKPQITLPGPALWPWILGGLLLGTIVIAASAYVWTWLRDRGMPATTSVSISDARPPHEIAYSELDRIAVLDLPAQGQTKHHYTLLADCLRVYIQGRYYIPAMDQTTEELMTAFRQARIDREHSSLLRTLFTEADLVKFAKYYPPIDQARAAVVQARHFVDITKPDELASQQTVESADSALATGITNHESRST